jgi:hypothetical protein
VQQVGQRSSRSFNKALQVSLPGVRDVSAPV